MKTYLKILPFLIFISVITIHSQNKSEIFKSQGDNLMRQGKYQDAIDQFNKFIAADPNHAEGYHLRGLCYEQNQQYEYAVIDLRRARKLDPGNSEIRNDLNHAVAVWYKQLNKSIEGYKRDILADPNNAISYLEIGKSYRWLEDWRNAEEWYDEYLKRDENVSADEIIRYTEILSKTGSIAKGERVLKKYTEQHPDDWRIWSRHGYFCLWLGKFQTAENAFKSSLSIKANYQEAKEGLKLSKRQESLTKNQEKQKVEENTESQIDTAFRLLNDEPENYQLRFDLADKLISANRYEEAYQQLQYLSPAHKDDEKFKSQLKIVTDYRDTTFNREVNHYTELLKENPSDKEAVMKLASAYGNLFYYNSAIEILEEYLQDIPSDQDLDARFEYSQYCAWNYEWEKATVQIDKLLELDPNNLDYQLLRAQICIMTVDNLELGEKYLLNVFSSRPDDINVLTSLTTLYVWKNNFSEAEKYLILAKQVSPNNPEIEKTEKNYISHKAEYDEQLSIQSLKVDANSLFSEGKCGDAFEKYNKYISKHAAVTRDELIEYANICSCAKKYTQAIEAYSKALDQQYDYSLAIKRAVNYYYDQNYTKSDEELELLSKEKSDDESRLALADAYTSTFHLDKAEEIYKDLKLKAEDDKQKQLIDERMILLGENYVEDKKLEKAEKIFDEINRSITDPSLKKELNQKLIFLGDAYVMNEKYSDAKRIYYNLLNESSDAVELQTVKERINWLPPSGLSRGISEIKNFFSILLPNKSGILPFSNYYSDNQKFRLWNYGIKAEADFFGFLSLGASVTRANLNNSVFDKDFTQLKGIAGISFSKYVSLKGSYGIWEIFGELNKSIADITFKYETENDLSAILSVGNDDLRMTDYSSNLIMSRINIDYYSMNLIYNYNELFKISGAYKYFRLSDGNEGNDFQIRLGRKFFDDGIFGYEYFFSDYAFISARYYSPQNYDSHCLWGEWNWTLTNLKLKVAGKIGYVPFADYIIEEISGEAVYDLISNLSIEGKIGYGNNSRYGNSYKNISASLNAYWRVF